MAVCAGFLQGCESQSVRSAENAVTDYYMDDYAAAERILEPLARKTDENFVLNNARLGSVALARYDLNTAEDAFMRAYEVINSVGVNNGGRTLGATVISENIKVWKGEPFERAMVNFYLGLIYYMRHDYNNARACFENAAFKLRDYGEGADKTDAYREQESDFALVYLMLGKSLQRLGRYEDAQKAFDRTVELSPFLAPVADARRNQRSNILLAVDFGRGPLKATTASGAIVGFVPTPAEEGPIPLPIVAVDGRQVDLDGINRPPVDLLALAQDRRWQSIDTIRAVKSGLGAALIAGGLTYGAVDRHANPYIALGLIAGGLAMRATSHADIRQWEMLPRTTFILPLSLPPGRHDVTVDFPGVPGLYQEWRGLDVPAQGEATYYFRMLRYDNGPHTWPPGNTSP
jgi:tetratricopeptide (TPR) repeat protein